MKIINKDQLVFSYSKQYYPNLIVNVGEIFKAETHERFSREEDADKIPGLTGPIFINELKAGEVIKIDILDIALTENFGVVISIPGHGIFGDIHDKKSVSIYSLDNEFVDFTKTIKVPLHPHIGRIAVAPPDGEYSSATLGPFGGNMDNTHICSNASIYLPVFVDGGLLSIGDIHACMGDGESNISGVETSGIVTMRCARVENFNIHYPFVENEREIMTTADGATFEEAAKRALREMVDILMDKIGLNFVKAAELVSIAANLRICQIVNPRIGVKVLISKEIIGNIFE